MPDELSQACALFGSREAAERAARALEEEGIAAEVRPPGTRFADLPPGTWELRAPASRLAEARDILAQK